ncbi:putative methyltransferase tdiE [Colletotrichum fructicola]|nr:putative methyltransferase tdiE [Colletotrichum fructicola]
MQRNPCTYSAADSENRACRREATSRVQWSHLQRVRPQVRLRPLDPQLRIRHHYRLIEICLKKSTLSDCHSTRRRWLPVLSIIPLNTDADTTPSAQAHMFFPTMRFVIHAYYCDKLSLSGVSNTRWTVSTSSTRYSGYRNWDRYLGYVIGNDLSAIQPEWVPPNVKFEIDDVESPWIGDRKLAKAREEHLRSHLNPGGWVEFQDTSIEYYSDDGTLTEEHFFRQWNKTLVEAIASIGREPSPGPKLEGWIRNTGFQRINHSKIKIPLAPWPRDPFYKALGAMNLKQVLDGLEGFTMRVFCGVLGQTQEEVQVMMAAVRNELKKLHSFHSQFDLSASS